METAPDRDDLHKIVVLNPKGGSGKTTLATNLASYYALRGPPPTLIDCDPKGFTMRWLHKRPEKCPTIDGIPAYDQPQDGFRHRLRPGTRTVIYDLPGGLGHDKLQSQTYDANSILIPVLPSEIDVFSASRFIADLLLVAQFDRRNRQLAVVANRTRENTKSYQMLMRFLRSLKIPLIATLRDSQAYVQAAAEGIGIYEMPLYRVRKDIAQMGSIITWLDQWRMRQIDAMSSAQYEQMPGSRVLTPAQRRDTPD